MELMKDRVAVRSGVEEARERNRRADRLFLLRVHDDARELDGFLGVRGLPGRTIELDGGRDADACQLETRCGECRRVPGRWPLDPDDGVLPIVFRGTQCASGELGIRILQYTIRD